MGDRPLCFAVAPMVLWAAPAFALAQVSEADALLDQGLASSRQGDSVQALDCLSRARSLYRHAGDARGEAAALGYLGIRAATRYRRPWAWPTSSPTTGTRPAP